MRKIIFIFAAIFLFGFVPVALAYQLNLVYLSQGNVQVNNPEVAQKFYDGLQGKPRDYIIDSKQDFDLYINLLVPEVANREGRYSATISSINGTTEQQVAELDANSADWNEYYE